MRSNRYVLLVAQEADAGRARGARRRTRIAVARRSVRIAESRLLTFVVCAFANATLGLDRMYIAVLDSAPVASGDIVRTTSAPNDDDDDDGGSIATLTGYLCDRFFFLKKKCVWRFFANLIDVCR